MSMLRFKSDQSKILNSKGRNFDKQEKIQRKFDVMLTYAELSQVDIIAKAEAINNFGKHIIIGSPKPISTKSLKNVPFRTRKQN